MRGVLPDDVRDVLSYHWQAERPVHEQQVRTGLSSSQKVIAQQPGRKPKTDEKLDAFNAGDQTLQSDSSSSPFEQDILVFTSQCALSSMRLEGNQSEQRIELKAA